MSENRSEERFDVSLTARLYGSATRQDIRISDLSARGCYVDSIAEVFVGEAMLIRILISKGEWLELESVVAHFSPGLGFGVRFVNPDERLRHNILLLIQRANPKLAKDPEGAWRLGEIDASRQHVVKSGDLFGKNEPVESNIN